MNHTSLKVPASENHSELLRNQRIYKYALQNANIGVWDFDIVNNKVYHSKESKIIFGYNTSDNELSEIDWRELIHPDDLHAVKQKVNEHIKGQTSDFKSEHRIICKNGSYKWVSEHGKVISHDNNGQPTRFIGTTSDITEQKADNERKIQNLNIISNQNKKLTNFAHIVTHNLKEYSGNFESLLQFYDEANSDDEKAELANHLKTVSGSLSNTIKHLSDIVQQQLKQKIEVETLNVNEYINKAINILELEIVNKKAIINNNVDNSLYLYSNPAYLESIILNLASNALKYSHPDRIPVIDINSYISDSEIRITVKDNGVGIDLEKYGNRIFGLYNTFHGNENAQGVGLYITKNQIESLGGVITVKSEVNVGTTFIITINTKNQQ